MRVRVRGRRLRLQPPRDRRLGFASHPWKELLCYICGAPSTSVGAHRKSAAQHDVEAVVEADSKLPPTPSARSGHCPTRRTERPASP